MSVTDVAGSAARAGAGMPSTNAATAEQPPATSTHPVASLLDGAASRGHMSEQSVSADARTDSRSTG